MSKKVKGKPENAKEIVALDDHEHVRLKPTMWIGSIEPSQESLVLVKENKLVSETKIISVGFYKLMNEIVDNAFDEAKRQKGKMPKITVEFDSFTSRVTVKDTGEGFYRGTELNSKTGITNIETAMTQLKAGSNFFSNETEENLIGTNGVGASLVNMLSEEFTIETVNETDYFKRTWKDFKPDTAENRKRKKGDQTGTIISYIPLAQSEVYDQKVKLFGGCVWDKEYVHSQMIFRNYLKNADDIINNLEFEVFFDGEKLDLNISFLPKDTLIIKNKVGVFAIWRKYENATSVSFMNGAQCIGIHQKIFNDWINEQIFDYNYAHHFYETLVILNLPPKVVRFADQNKTKYAGGRWEIESTLKKAFMPKLQADLPKSTVYKEVKKAIEERLYNDAMNSIKRKKKQKKQKVSEKYVPPTNTKDTLFIVEGNSARGSILQRRNSESDGVYTLKGKIKNARSLSDLSKNNEIIDIMNILGIDPKNYEKCNYTKIVIATDWDPDGIGHIASLLINLFYRWFPTIIDQGKLYILITPLVATEVGGKNSYFYSIKEFSDFEEKNKGKCKNTRYLKGLGSLDIPDWDWVMAQRRMFKIYNDRSSKRFMDIAFGTSSQKRKNWLQSAE